MKHLWEEKHYCYCNDGCWMVPDGECVGFYESFQDFLEEWDGCYFDYNLLFRWDWVEKAEENEQEHDLLKLYWMKQLHGQFIISHVKIKREDEEQVKKFLIPRMKHLFDLWKPLYEEGDE